MPSPTSPLARHRQLAPTASVRVSPLCLGAMTFGDSQPERYGEMTKETAFKMLDCFYGQGGNFVDTANAYQYGQSEEWIGEWMEIRGVRDEMVIATKYTTGWQLKHKNKIQSNFGGNGTKSMKLALEASLARLKTTYVDLYYVHWWDYTTTIPELMHSLNDLVVSGKVHYLGISDTPAWIVTQANQYARCNGLRQFTVYQGMWNAAMRDFERDIIPMCRSEGMGICAYGVLNQGRFQTQAGFREREQQNPGRNFIKTTEHDKKISLVLEEIANANGIGLLEVALAYVMQKTTYVFPIVGGRKVEHLQGVIPGLRVDLSEDDIMKVESAYPFDYGFPNTFLSGSLFDGGPSRTAEGPGDVWQTRNLGSFDWVHPPQPLRQH